jgi:transposase
LSPHRIDEQGAAMKDELARYGQAFKDRAVARLLPPESATLDGVAHEIGVGVSTLERWRSEALSRPARERAWTAAARFEAVLTTAAMDEAGKSAWCRENGVYPQELAAWRQSATQALAEPEEARASPQQTRQDRKRRIKELERDLRRKDKALAETAALAGAVKKSRGDLQQGRGRMIGLEDRQTLARTSMRRSRPALD